MQSLSLTAQRPAVRGVAQRRVRSGATQVAEAETAQPKAAPTSGRQAEIYIGHSKDQVEEKKAGKQGRFVVDDPKKYPGRDNDFVGGWAGGEVGLKSFVSNTQRERELNQPSAKAEKGGAHQPRPIAKGSDTIYVGKGRVIQDDARKYPGRNELTGGFAGGELGLQAFKEKGDVPIAADGQGTRQSSPLITAFVLGLAATGGGLLLSTVEEAGLGAVKSGEAGAALSATSVLGLDEQTKALLTAGILLVGVIGTVVGTQVLVDTMAARLKAGASKLATLGAFWVAVFLAAKFVLES
ncbi:supervillin isoform X3 [Chlorella sorokiniana]|jgi:hypothetical protein|uniref:Supervillin isoform X3 n=1 Tax=Chlorella sorokiniana TaxID=3076 RepID=A0A2P6TS98_CHLSO|nr:supervillin isoform X3 [Chlorella sorokiniana]|eukprot:PRW56942.1 supervillin isoform X3 [Chlorella sorokiniana]